MRKAQLMAAALMASVAGGFGGLGVPGAHADTTMEAFKQGGQQARDAGKAVPSRSASAAAQAMRALYGSFGGVAGWRYPKPGHSVRQGQRMARKRRNVQRNRAAHR